MSVITQSFIENNHYSLKECFATAQSMLRKGYPDILVSFLKELQGAETASSINTVNRCGQLYKYKYIESLRRNRATPVNLALGTLVHSGLEYYWRMIQGINDRGEEDFFDSNSGGLLEALDLSVEHQDKDFWSDEKSDIWKCQATAMLRGYYDLWLGTDTARSSLVSQNGYHTIKPEFAFIYISEGGKLRVGKMDVLMLQGKSYAVCMEHKTTSDSRVTDLSSPYWRKLEIDTQLCFYRGALKAMYPDRIPRMVYDVIRKTAKKPLKGRGTKKKSETVEELVARKKAGNESLVQYTNRLFEEDYGEGDEMFVRNEVILFDDQQREVSTEIDWTVDLLDDKKFLDRRNPTACQYFGNTCEFLGACTGADSTSDPGLFSKKAAKHIELEEM